MRALKSYGALLSAVALIVSIPAATASVFYKMDVVAATPVGGFNAFGTGPSVNDKGKVAFVAKSPSGPTVMAWTPTGGVTDLATNFLSPNRNFGEAVKINNNDEIATWNRLLPLGLYEVRVFRAATPNDTSIAVRGITGGTPYEILYQYPTMNNNRVLEDRLQGLPGNKDGVCDTGEVCLSQIAFNAVRQVPSRFLGTVVQTPINAADNGVQHEFGMNTSQSRPAMAEDGRIVIRGVNATDPINLFNYALGAPTAIANAAMGFTALGAASGITPDGKIIAFAGNRGHGDGVFLSLLLPSGQRRLVRIVGENATVQKAELGLSATSSKLFFSTIDLGSRVGIVYTPGRTGIANGAIVVTFVGTPNGASRTNAGTGKPYVHSANKGLWAIRIELDNPRFEDVCNVRAPGVTGNPFTLGGDDTIKVNAGVSFVDSGANGVCESGNGHDVELLFARAGPIPVVQVGDRILAHTVADIAVHDPIAPANYLDSGAARQARLGDHRVTFWADVGGGNHIIVRAEHLDTDQDGLMDHWETTGIDLEGTGSIDLDLSLMGATPFQRDFFVQIDFAADRARPLNVGERHRPIPGVIRRLAQFYASAPASPAGVPAGIRLHVDAGTGIDRSGQFMSRNMGIGPLFGGALVHPQPIDLIYFGAPGSVSHSGVTAVDYDTIKQNTLRISHRGAREFAFTHVVWADFHTAFPNNTTPYTKSATSGDAWYLYDTSTNFIGVRGHGVLITGGTGAGQIRTIISEGFNYIGVTSAWTVPPDSTSTYMLIDGSSGLSQPGNRYDGAFSPGKNFSLTLGGFGFDATGREQGSFAAQWKTLAHEIGHNHAQTHGGNNHTNYKATYVSLMNYAYQLCTTGVGKDASGVVLPGGAACPVDGYGGPSDAVWDNWGTLDLASSLNPARTGQALGDTPDPNTVPFPPPEAARTLRDVLIQNGPQDTRAPIAAIGAPATGTTIAQGNGIAVSFTATDDVAVTRAEVLFDVNGNGEIEEPAEVFAATAGGGGAFTANVPAVGGPSGTRSLTVYAFDAVGNPGTTYVRINVGSVAPVNVPSVTGSTEEAARTALLAAQLEVGTITRQQSGSVPAGSVISQNPAAGQSHPPGTGVALVISLGTNGALVPNVTGLMQGAAGTAITTAGFTVGAITQAMNSLLPPGTVIGQSPLGGGIAAGGSAVLLLVAAVSGNVTVPNVVNLTQAAAQSAITGAGLTVGTVSTQSSPTVPAGIVMAQNPAAGNSVPPGSPVDIVVSSGPANGFAPGTTFVASVSNAVPTVITSLAVACPATGTLVVTGSGESAAKSNFAGSAFIGVAYSIARDSTATDNGNVVQSSALAVFNGDANRDFLNVQRVDTCTPGQNHTYHLTAYATTPQTSTVSGSFVWNGRLTASPGPATSSLAAGTTYVASAANGAPTVVATLPVICPASGMLAVTGSGESAARSNFAGNAFIGLAYSIARDSLATDNGNVVQSSALAVFNGDANRDFLNVQRVDACTPGQNHTYRLTVYATTPQTGIASESFVWNGRLTATALPVVTSVAPGTTLIGSATNAAPTVVSSLNVVCPASGTTVVSASGESAAKSNFGGNAFIGLAYSIARDSTATDNGNVVQSSALAAFNGDANRDFLNVERADNCTPGQTSTYYLTAYATTPQTDIANGSFVWNGRLVAILPP